MGIQSLGWEDPLKEVMATHSSILIWRIPWTEKPDGLQSLGSQRNRHDWSDLAPSTYIHVYTYMKEDSEISPDPSLIHSSNVLRRPEVLRLWGVGVGMGCTERKMVNVLTFRDLLSNGSKWKMNSTCIPSGRFCIMIQVAEHIQEGQDKEWLDGKKGL